MEFEFNSIDNVFELIEEEELGVEDIVYTENEQEEDIIEEIIKLYPDMKKGLIFKKIKFFSQLKHKHSESYLLNDKDENYERLFMEAKKKFLLKTENYKPLLKNYMRNNYQNQYLIPLVQSTLNEYENEFNEEKLIEFPSQIKKQIEDIEKIDIKFKNNIYLDYDTKQQEKEIFLKPRRIENNFTGYNTRINDDVFVIDYTSEKFNSFIVLGNQKRLNLYDDNIITINGEKVSIIGYLHIPQLKNNNLSNPYNKKINSKPIDELFKENKDIIQQIDLTNEYRYKNNSKVKVCIKDNDKVMEIKGSIKGNKKGFIFLEPDDKSLLNENKIFEFPVNDGNIKIEKINEICDVNNQCVDSNKMIFYNFPDTKINEKTRENLLDQIIPSIKQILNRHDFSNIVNIQDIEKILFNYNLNYHDLEINNANKIRKILKKNINKIEKVSNKNIQEIEKLKKNHKAIQNTQEEKYIKIEHNHIKNEDFKKIKDFYPEYINNKFSFDNDTERVNWLHNQLDYGKLLALYKRVDKKPELYKEIQILENRNKLMMINLLNQKEQKIENIEKKETEFENNKIKEEDVENLIVKDEFDEDLFPQFTDITGFNEKGQRIELGEVISLEDNLPIEPTNSDIFDSIANYLNTTQIELIESDEDISNIHMVLNTLINIMGVNIDILKIDKKCLVLYRDSYKTLSSFKKKLKEAKKKKTIEKQHQEYNLKNLIYICSSYLLIYCQLTLKTLIVSPYAKCIPKLSGFPLEDEEEFETFGINYIVCVLSTIKESKGIWGVLEKKEIIRNNFDKTLKKLLTASIKLRLEKRNEEIEKERLLLEEQNKTYQWNEFRPLLKKLGNDYSKEIDLGDTNFNSKKSIKKSIRLFKDKLNTCSLNIVDYINNIIESQPLENILYDPLPLSNSCCLEEINNDFNYLSYLQENDLNNNLNKLIKNSREMASFNDSLNDNKFYIIAEEGKKKLKSYAKNIFLNEEEVEQALSSNNTEIINNIYKNYIETEDNVCIERHLFQIKSEYNGSNDVSIGSKNEILSLISKIKENNKVNIKDKKIIVDKKQNEINKIINCINNDFLLKNDFNNVLIEELQKLPDKITDRNINNVWKLQDNSVTRYRDTLYQKLVQNVSDKNKKNIKNILNNILQFNNIEKEELEIINENNTIIKKELHLKALSYKRKEIMIKKYIFNYLLKYCQVLSNINNKEKVVVEKTERLEEKKLIDKEFKLFLPFFEEKNIKYFKLISESIRPLNNLKKINGYQDIFGCNIKLESSIIDFEKSSKLFEINFYYSLIHIIDIIDNFSNKKTSKLKQEDVELDEDDSDENYSILDKKGYMIRDFIIELLKKIDNDRAKFYNVYTQNNVVKEVKRKNEEKKDENLAVMERLDLEEKELRNLLTKAGLTKYEDLAKDYADLLREDEIDKKLHKEFMHKFNIKESDEQFENKFLDFKLENEKRVKEEMDIIKDNIEFAKGEDDDDVYGM